MNSVPLHWKLKKVLDEEGITPYRFIQESGVSSTTIYRITSGRSVGVQGRILDEILRTLHQLTGKRYSPSDVLGWQPEEVGHG